MLLNIDRNKILISSLNLGKAIFPQRNWDYKMLDFYHRFTVNYLWKFDDSSPGKRWLVVRLCVWLHIMMLILRIPLYSASSLNHSIKSHYRPAGQNIKIGDYYHAQYRLSCIWELSAPCTLGNRWKNCF